MTVLLVFGVVLLALVSECGAQGCNCRDNCQNNEYESGGGNCMPMKKNCCTKECNYGGESQSCGTGQGCFELYTSSVTTPQNQRSNNCPDPKIRNTQTPCENGSCADCKFQWAEWGQCSVTCGPGGRQTRTRSQTQAAIGQGKCNLSNDERNCMPSPPPCPVPCVVSPWSMWSACGGTCAPALRQRVRTIVSREMFGGEVCPDVSSADQCFDVLPICADATIPLTPSTTRFVPPTPRPTPPPTPVPPTPMPTAPAQVSISFGMSVTPSSVIQLGEAGSLLAVNNVMPNSDATITWANGAIGVSDAAFNSPGEIAAPFAAQFQFTTRRAMRTITFKGFDAGETATLVAFNRLGRRRAGETAFIEIKDPNTPLMPHTAIGFDTYEIRPGPNSKFGVVSFDSPMPDASMFVAQSTTANGGGDATPGAPDDTGPQSPIGGDVSSGGLPTYVIAIIVVVGVLLVTCIVVLIVVYIVKNRDDDDEALSRHHDTPSTNVDAILNGGTIHGNHQTVGHFHDVAPPPALYEQVPATQFGTMQLHQQLQQQQQQQQPYQADDHGGIAYGAEMARSSAQYGRVTEPDFFAESAPNAGTFNTMGGGGGGQVNYNTLPSHPHQTQQIQYSGLN